jgi:hypothetical protein
MAKNRRRFDRPLDQRRYRPLSVVATEGTKTEPGYFRILAGQLTLVDVLCLKRTSGSDPLKVLKSMEAHLRKASIRPGDEAWLVVDRDQWTDEQLDALHKWATQANNRGLAVSNPKFELWLLLHFDDARGVVTATECDQQLQRHLPHYNKELRGSDIPAGSVVRAVERASRRDTPRCTDWPRTGGVTTVYRLVERILGSPMG